MDHRDEYDRRAFSYIWRRPSEALLFDSREPPTRQRVRISKGEGTIAVLSDVRLKKNVTRATQVRWFRVDWIEGRRRVEP